MNTHVTGLEILGLVLPDTTCLEDCATSFDNLVVQLDSHNKENFSILGAVNFLLVHKNTVKSPYTSYWIKSKEFIQYD